jgi:hypothetical protein
LEDVAEKEGVRLTLHPFIQMLLNDIQEFERVSIFFHIHFRTTVWITGGQSDLERRNFGQSIILNEALQLYLLVTVRGLLHCLNNKMLLHTLQLS